MVPWDGSLKKLPERSWGVQNISHKGGFSNRGITLCEDVTAIYYKSGSSVASKLGSFSKSELVVLSVSESESTGRR